MEGSQNDPFTKISNTFTATFSRPFNVVFMTNLFSVTIALRAPISSSTRLDFVLFPAFPKLDNALSLRHRQE